MKTNVRDSSLAAFRDAILSGKGQDKAMRVFEAVKRIGPCTRRQVAEFTGMDTSAVSGRMNDLVASGLVLEDDEIRPCPITRKRVHWVSVPVQGRLI